MAVIYNKQYPQLVELDVASKILKWYSSDREDFYKKNVKEGWRWKDTNIEYKFNTLGYRTKEVSQLDKDFLLTFGCSFTEGIGLFNEQVWPNKLANLLNLDVYNAGKGGSGLDICYYNALLWKENNLPLPKQVVLQLPEPERKSWGSYKNNNISLDVSNGKEDDWWKYYITSAGEIHMNNIAWYLGFNNVWQSLNVPVLNITWSPYTHLENLEFKLHYSNIEHDPTLLARDNMHSGPEWHINLANKCKELL